MIKAKNELLGFLSVVFLGIVTLFGQIQNDVIRSVDAPCYALIGKELAARPFIDWVRITLNGTPFFEHPHLTPWILGLSMKLFGVGTMQALLPIVFLSLLSVILAYFLGRILLNHSYGLLCAFVLALTPAFIKEGRNPMLEPALMLTLMSALYFHLRFLANGHRIRDSFLTGLFFALAFLAKGPPAFLVPAVMLGFYFYSQITKQGSERFRLSFKLFAIHLVLVFAVAAALILMIDLWSVLASGESFFYHYAVTQLQSTVVNARGAQSNILDFYRPNLFKYYPWNFLMLLSFPLLVWKQKREAMPACIFSLLASGGVFLGFTLMKHKAYWYPNIHFVSSSLLAAVSLYVLMADKKWFRFLPQFCLTVGTTVLFFGAAFPSLFIYPRPTEQLLESIQKEYHETFKGEKVANCIDLGGWRGSFLLKFYLDADLVACEDSGAALRLVNLRADHLNEKETILSSNERVALVRR